MALGGFVVESLIRFNTSGLAKLNESEAALNRLSIAEAKLRGQITTREAQWLQAAEQRRQMYQRENQLITQISAGVALVGAASIGYVADQAAKLQQILISIKNETGASASNIAGAYNTIFAIGNNSGMNPIEAGEIMRTVTRMNAGLRMNGQAMTMNQMRSVAPMVADFASMIHFNRPDVDVNNAAMTGLQMAHLFRAYDPKKLSHLLDLNYRLSGLMGEQPDQALRQMSYYEPMFKGLGISDDTSVALMALLDRAGFRNKVGTNVRAQLLEALGPMQLTRSAGAGKMHMLEQMGIFKNGKFAWNNADGSTNYLGMLGQLAEWGQAQHAKGVPDSDIAKIIYGTFGRQGGTIASLMADPQMKDILAGIRDYLHDNNVSLAQGIKHRDSSLVFQFQRAAGNLSAVLIELGSPWMDDLTKFFKGLADNLNTFRLWLHGHRDAEKNIGLVFASLTGLAAMIAAVGATSQLLMFLGIIKTLPNAIGLLISPFRWLVSALWAISTGGTAASGALALVGSAIKGWATAGAAFLASPFGLFIAALIGFSAATTTTAGAGEFKEGDAYWLKRAMTNGWYSMPKTVRDQLYGEGYRPDVSHHDDRHVIHIHGPLVVQSNDPKHMGHEIQKTARHAAANQGVLKSLPRVHLGPSSHFLHAQ